MSVIRWLLMVAAVLACVAVGYGAYTLAGASWDAVVSYESPYAAAPQPASGLRSAAASRTVYVIVDGLRLDASRSMGTLNNLRQYGADLELRAPEPSLSYPNWTTLLSGAPPYVSGVVTNWHEGEAPVETIFDTARSAETTTVFVGPEDFKTLYGVDEKVSASYMREWDESYLSTEYVDAALRLTKSENPRLLVIHLPDVDEAGHRSGGASADYAQTVSKVDSDIGRLVDELQDGHTVFIVASDHGHLDTGGHGGWEPEVIQVPAVISGPGVRIGTGEAAQEDVASTVAGFTGIGVPRHSAGRPIESAVGEQDDESPVTRQSVTFAEMYGSIVGAPMGAKPPPAAQATPRLAQLDEWTQQVEADRLAYDRSSRLGIALGALLVAIVVLAVIGFTSWRALLAAFTGAIAYFALYNGLFFLVHGYDWSLSAFNSEDLIDAWMNLRLIEAAVSMLVGAFVAGAVYPFLRAEPKGAHGRYLPGWLTLGPATALVVLAVLGVQAAWFYWAWGIVPVWRLPDLMWAFKYDLDLIQATAVGFAAVLTPLVTWLVGRYHPRVKTTT